MSRRNHMSPLMVRIPTLPEGYRWGFSQLQVRRNPFVVRHHVLVPNKYNLDLTMCARRAAVPVEEAPERLSTICRRCREGLNVLLNESDQEEEQHDPSVST